MMMSEQLELSDDVGVLPPHEVEPPREEDGPCPLPFRYTSMPMYWVPLVAPWQCNLGTALLWPLQLYWFALICRGALRLFTKRSNSPPAILKADGNMGPANSCTTNQTAGGGRGE